MPVPPGVVTAMVPVVPAPTVAVIWVSESTVKELTVVPPIATAVAPVNCAPVITTTLPVQPEPGEKELMVGADVPDIAIRSPEGLMPDVMSRCFNTEYVPLPAGSYSKITPKLELPPENVRP